MTTTPPNPDPDAIAAAAQACPHVVRLGGGALGEVATYLPGRRVTGVRVTDRVVEIHVVGRYGPTVDEIAGQVRDAVRAAAGPVIVDVVIDDLEDAQPGRSTPREPPTSLAAAGP